ncbi:MAG: hypothetical protein J6P94_00935 [Oscillospiraceae bacterium]|nr:hypothetical protein [Oscillospiraceae bacterium]
MKNASKKAIVLLLAAVLLIGCVAGGTFAYLLIGTAKVDNTFVAGDIGDLKLEETEKENYLVIPGVNITKDPKVTFGGNNVDAYVFLKIDAKAWTVSGSDTTYTYSIGTGDKEMKWVLEGWTKLEDGVYYKAVAANATTETWTVIKDNKITVGTGITETEIASYANVLSFTAYAVQKDTFATPAAAWAQVKTENSIA